MPPRDRTKRRVVPTQERAQASVEAILGAARELLRDEGFTRMTTNRVAERAGVNVALVYRYFAGKEAIVAALIEQAIEHTHAAVEAVLRAHASSPLPVAVRALLQTMAETPATPELHRELAEHIDVTQRRAQVHELHRRLSALFVDFLAGRRAELPTLSDPEATLFVLTHAVAAATHAAAFYRPAELSLERALDALSALAVGALTDPR
jgi:AcrR family transcriptional regulator